MKINLIILIILVMGVVIILGCLNDEFDIELQSKQFV